MFLDRSWPIRGGAVDTYIPLNRFDERYIKKKKKNDLFFFPLGKKGPRQNLPATACPEVASLNSNRKAIFYGHRIWGI